MRSEPRVKPPFPGDFPAMFDDGKILPQMDRELFRAAGLNPT